MPLTPLSWMGESLKNSWALKDKWKLRVGAANVLASCLTPSWGAPIAPDLVNPRSLIWTRVRVDFYSHSKTLNQAKTSELKTLEVFLSKESQWRSQSNKAVSRPWPPMPLLLIYFKESLNRLGQPARSIRPWRERLGSLLPGVTCGV